MGKLKFVLILKLTFFSCLGLSQNYKEYLKLGDRYYKVKDYSRAITNYQKALSVKSGNTAATFKLGMSYLQSDNKVKALSYLEQVHKIDPNIDKEIDYYLGLAYQYNYRYDEARASFENYKENYVRNSYLADFKIKECIIGDSLLNRPLNVKISNLGPTVNSRFNDYTPFITSDGNSMVFTSNRAGSTGGLRLKDGTYYEDVYITKRINGAWQKPERISPKINFKYHDAAASFSPDGKTLFLYKEEGAGDIYVSEFIDGEWTYPVTIGNINSDFWETAVSVTSDGKTLYFTSERPGGFGGLDIYRSERQENGEWGPGRNLGPVINTDGSEDSPFIHPDGKTLYFSSNGHVGMGGHDIFYSELVDGQFQKPKNMGYPINTAFNDNYFVISEDKQQAYYASVRSDGEGMADIYFIDMSKIDEIIPQKVEEPVQPVAEEKPEVVAEADDAVEDKYYDDGFIQLQKDLGIVTKLSGKVIDAETAEPLYAQIILMDNTNNKIMVEINSNPETGDFELFIPHGGNYGVSTKKHGYLFNSINFNLPSFTDYQEIDTHIILQKAAVGSKVVLKNIFFDSGKSDLKLESLSELDRIKELLDENDQLQVQINGHTDNVGNAVYNKVLSKRRAQSVVNYLVEHGIGENRLTAKGFGEERPLVSNDDEKDGREINRRTEIEIIGVGAES